MSFAAIGELTIPQLILLNNDGKWPNPRHRTFASAQDAAQHIEAQRAKDKEQPPCST